MIGIMLLSHVRDLPNGMEFSPPPRSQHRVTKNDLLHPNEFLTPSRHTKTVKPESRKPVLVWP